MLLKDLGGGSRRLSKRARFCVHFYDIVLVCVFFFKCFFLPSLEVVVRWVVPLVGVLGEETEL